MTFEETITTTHTYNTREDYVIIEESEDIRAEIHCHGYDNEDGHLYDLIKEMRFENPKNKYRLMFIRQVIV